MAWRGERMFFFCLLQLDLPSRSEPSSLPIGRQRRASSPRHSLCNLHPVPSPAHFLRSTLRLATTPPRQPRRPPSYPCPQVAGGAAVSPPPPTRPYFCLPYSAPPARHATTFVATPPPNRDVRHPDRGLSKPTPFALRYSCNCKPRYLRRHAALAHSVLACCGRLPSPGQCMAVTPHHRLYEFAKTALVKIFAFPYATVCDMYCDGGVDTDKWGDAQIGHYIGIDVSASGVSDAREIWENKRKPFTAEFIELDPSADDFEAKLQEQGIQADIVCCMRHLQLCFESEEQAKKLLNNVSSLLKPGGYFLGITPDSSTIWTKYQKNVEASHNKGLKTVPNSIRSENYIITFEVEEEKFPFFGKKYQLKFANEVMFENHCLVHFPSLMRLAREAGLEYVEIQNLTEFYDDNRTQFAPMLGSCGASLVDPRGKLVARSYDILGLYSTFVFQKPDPDAIPPIVTPDSHDPDNAHEEQEWLWRQQTSVDDGRRSQADTIPMDHEKGILGPGPADMRL